MKAYHLAWLAAALAPPAIHADTAPWGAHSVLREHEAIAARFEVMPEADLKAVYLRCDAEANRRLLDFGDAALCSLAYEALKRRVFGGDFDALLAWWRTQPRVP
ncbi:MAG: hypothetical protein IT503_08590 [Burkholderiaceae bacterium]|nr:MAG: hypothetical protein F9K36_09380 [Burkholderiaceae bacterium]MBE7425339.1 hypothetical protein [Ideonella sp.]MCC7286227.1 hypothetical protein [Burkholderiaceae bacterium]